MHDFQANRCLRCGLSEGEFNEKMGMVACVPGIVYPETPGHPSTEGKMCDGFVDDEVRAVEPFVLPNPMPENFFGKITSEKIQKSYSVPLMKVGVGASLADLDSIALRFEPVMITTVNGAPLGMVTRVWREGATLMGECDCPISKVSCEVNIFPPKLLGVVDVGVERPADVSVEVGYMWQGKKVSKEEYEAHSKAWTEYLEAKDTNILVPNFGLVTIPHGEDERDRRRRIKTFCVSQDVMPILFGIWNKNNHEFVYLPRFPQLPPDADIEDVRWDEWRRQFVLRVWSSTFDVVPDGAIIPTDEKPLDQMEERVIRVKQLEEIP